MTHDERRARNRRIAERIIAEEMTYDEAALDSGLGVHYIMNIVRTYRRAMAAKRKAENDRERRERKREENS